jgi:hypothetical protein
MHTTSAGSLGDRRAQRLVEAADGRVGAEAKYF